MSEKEYEIDYNEFTGKYTVTEKEPYHYESSPPSTDHTMRERIGDKMVEISPKSKMILVSLFDIYGFLYRFGSNQTLSFLFSFIQLASLNCFGILWIVDWISVKLKGDIILLGRKKYKDYVPKRKI